MSLLQDQSFSQAFAVRLSPADIDAVASVHRLKLGLPTGKVASKLASRGSNCPSTPAITPASLVPTPGPRISAPPSFRVTDPFAVTCGVSGDAFSVVEPENEAPFFRVIDPATCTPPVTVAPMFETSTDPPMVNSALGSNDSAIGTGSTDSILNSFGSGRLQS